jgi:AraC-like DNA-binding protein
MDVLSDVLDTVRLTSTIVVQTRLAAPWGMRTAPRDSFAFHVVSGGTAWFAADGADPVALAAGDVVVLAPGHGHTLRSHPSAPVRDVLDLLADGTLCRPAAGDPADGTRLVCGSFRFDDPHGTLLAVLPAVLHAQATAGDAGPWLAHTIELLTYESFGDQPGNATVVNRLCDALFVYLVRSHLASRSGAPASWLRGLADPQIRDALTLIHERPDHAWSVAALAGRVGMSRAAFAARFAELVGQTPIRYLTQWRVQKAAGLLRDDQHSIESIARRVGYESPVAFAKAFKRSTGLPPGAYRRRGPGVHGAPELAGVDAG